MSFGLSSYYQKHVLLSFSCGNINFAMVECGVYTEHSEFSVIGEELGHFVYLSIKKHNILRIGCTFNISIKWINSEMSQFTLKQNCVQDITIMQSSYLMVEIA